MAFETMNDASYRQEDGAVILHASAKSDFVVSPITERLMPVQPFCISG